MMSRCLAVGAEFVAASGALGVLVGYAAQVTLPIAGLIAR
jgi:hypothetical protein